MSETKLAPFHETIKLAMVTAMAGINIRDSMRASQAGAVMALLGLLDQTVMPHGKAKEVADGLAYVPSGLREAGLRTDAHCAQQIIDGLRQRDRPTSGCDHAGSRDAAGANDPCGSSRPAPAGGNSTW